LEFGELEFIRMNRVFIGIGSNEGDRLEAIFRAVRALADVEGVRVVQMAIITETDPVGGPPQGPYLNTVVEIETGRSPQALLGTLKEIEQRLGRRPSTERWGPRVIDLDLLLYGDRVIEEAELTVPHPRMHERRFVLEPLCQLASDLIHPRLRQPVETLLARLPASPQTASASGRPRP
jgi:2-amino-4-hydroxy-6-hydroxymethyldihydropteridine diphosphokinase